PVAAAFVECDATRIPVLDTEGGSVHQLVDRAVRRDPDDVVAPVRLGAGPGHVDGAVRGDRYALRPKELKAGGERQAENVRIEGAARLRRVPKVKGHGLVEDLGDARRISLACEVASRSNPKDVAAVGAADQDVVRRID